MKKLVALISFTLFALASCSSDDVGPRGPQGPQGPAGPPGEDGLIGTVFDVEGDFTDENEYSILVTYSDFTDVEVFESDVVLVYLRVGTDGEVDGEPVYLWRQLPQLYYVEGGSMQYNFDYSFFDVNIFLDGNVDLSSLDPVFTDDQVFRIALLPAEFANTTSADFSDYNALNATLKLEQREIPSIELK